MRKFTKKYLNDLTKTYGYKVLNHKPALYEILEDGYHIYEGDMDEAVYTIWGLQRLKSLYFKGQLGEYYHSNKLEIVGYDDKYHLQAVSYDNTKIIDEIYHGTYEECINFRQLWFKYEKDILSKKDTVEA